MLFHRKSTENPFVSSTGRVPGARPQLEHHLLPVRELEDDALGAPRGAAGGVLPWPPDAPWRSRTRRRRPASRSPRPPGTRSTPAAFCSGRRPTARSGRPCSATRFCAGRSPPPSLISGRRRFGTGRRRRSAAPPGWSSSSSSRTSASSSPAFGLVFHSSSSLLAMRVRQRPGRTWRLLVRRVHDEPREELLVRDERLPLGEVQVHVRELLRGGAPRHPHGRIARQEDHHLVVDARDEAEREDVLVPVR